MTVYDVDLRIEGVAKLDQLFEKEPYYLDSGADNSYVRYENTEIVHYNTTQIVVYHVLLKCFLVIFRMKLGKSWDR